MRSTWTQRLVLVLQIPPVPFAKRVLLSNMNICSYI